MIADDAHLLLNRLVTRLSGEEIDFVIHYWGATSASFAHPVHKHSFYEACYVASGTGTYREEGRAFPLRPGTVFLSRPDRFHQIQYGENMVLLYVGFDAVMSRDMSRLSAWKQYRTLRETNDYVAGDERAAGAIRTWQALWAHTAAPSSCFPSPLRQLAYALLCSFHSLFAGGEPEPDPARDAKRDADRLIYQARLFIRDNLAQRITAQDVANYLFISKRHLARLFFKEGESFTGCLRKSRIERAVSLLKDRRIPIKDIAAMIGFNSLHYFTKVFTQETGLPPGRFRSLNML